MRRGQPGWIKGQRVPIGRRVGDVQERTLSGLRGPRTSSAEQPGLCWDGVLRAGAGGQLNTSDGAWPCTSSADALRPRLAEGGSGRLQRPGHRHAARPLGRGAAWRTLQRAHEKERLVTVTVL